MKKCISLLLVLAVMASILCGCGKDPSKATYQDFSEGYEKLHDAVDSSDDGKLWITDDEQGNFGGFITNEDLRGLVLWFFVAYSKSDIRLMQLTLSEDSWGMLVYTADQSAVTKINIPTYKAGDSMHLNSEREQYENEINDTLNTALEQLSNYLDNSDLGISLKDLGFMSYKIDPNRASAIK